MNPGMCYCKGLYFRFSNRPVEAMQQFQLAVKDQRWKTKAIFEMIDIVLDPGNNFAMMEEENEENPECREQSKKAHQLLDQVHP